MRRVLLQLGVALATAALAAACTTAPGEESQDDVGMGDEAVTSLDPNVSHATAITEPEALRQLEAKGFAFGHHFIANLDLVERFKSGTALAQMNPATIYGGGAVGYTDYPAAVAADA